MDVSIFQRSKLVLVIFILEGVMLAVDREEYLNGA